MGLYGILVVTTRAERRHVRHRLSLGRVPEPGGDLQRRDPAAAQRDRPGPEQRRQHRGQHARASARPLVWSGLPGGCGNPSYVPSTATPACYPPAVNYTPLYYLINGVAFDRQISATASSASLFAPPAVDGDHARSPATSWCAWSMPACACTCPPSSGPDNPASLRPASPGPGPGLQPRRRGRQPAARRVPRAERSVHGRGQDLRRDDQRAGRRRSTGAAGLRPRAEPVRATRPRATPACWPTSASTARPCPRRPPPPRQPSQANPDTYNSVVPGQTLTVSDPAKGVIANDINVSGVQGRRRSPAG